jgi:predicted porin
MQARHSGRARNNSIPAAQAIALAAVIGVFSPEAHGADLTLDSLNDVPTALAAGVTIYGTVDVGGAYSSHGVPASGAFYPGADYTIFGSRFAGPAIGTITNNALEQSKIGVKIEESFGDGWAAIGKLETGFNPISGELSDACASLLRNNGKLYSQMDNNGDGSRCGQAFNSVAYGGVSNASYGTLTAGRQQSLMLDGLATYDPMVLSYAFSVLGYSGTPAAGIGSTETARWNNSVKYVYQYGPIHAAAMYSSGGQDTPMMGQGFGANIGGSYRGFSIDGFYTREYGAVNLSSFANRAYTTAADPFPFSNSCTAGIDCPNELVGTITNNEAWSVMAKYSFNIEEPAGGLKDEPKANDKLTLFAGFVYIDLSNPDHRQSFYNGFNTIGGYQFFTLGAGGVGPNYNPAYDRAFGSDRIQNTEWAGIRYDFSWGLNLTGAYYHWGQDSFLNNKGQNCATVTSANITNKYASPSHFVGNTAGNNCAGDFNQVSFLADYVFNKHFDVYAGVSYTTIGGGLASAFLNDNMIMFATGVRLKF